MVINFIYRVMNEPYTKVQFFVEKIYGKDYRIPSNNLYLIVTIPELRTNLHSQLNANQRIVLASIIKIIGHDKLHRLNLVMNLAFSRYLEPMIFRFHLESWRNRIWGLKWNFQFAHQL